MKFFKNKNSSDEKKEVKKNIKKDKKREIDKELNSKREVRIASIIPYKAVRAFLWILIGIIFVRGTGTLIRGSEAEKIDNQNKAFLETLSKESGLEVKAFSFAESFTREYFTRYPTKMDDFKNRIIKFTTEQLADDMNNKSYSEIISASAFSFEKYSSNQFNVGVEARVKQYVPKPNQESVSLDKLEYDINLVNQCIEVPVYISDDMNMVVDGLPVFIAGKEKADFDVERLEKQAENDSEIVSKINESVTQFFKAYYEQDQTQIDYFIENGSKPIKKPLGESKFKKLDTIEVFKLEDNQYLVVVKLTIDSYGNELKQGFNIKLVKSGDKYLIKELNTRTLNLNIK